MAHAPDPADGARVALPDSMAALRAGVCGLLGWIVPGLGHIFIGDHVRGIVCMVTIVLTFWTGVAIGGIRGTVDPRERSLWFMAQLCSGVNAGAAYALRQTLYSSDQQKQAAQGNSWVASEIGVHYTGVAGLLNILVILDAMARSEKGGFSPSRGRRGPPVEPAS